MASFRSNDEFFQAVQDLIARLEQKGHHEAAAGLTEGFRAINGLTDGSALFLHAIEGIQATASSGLDPDENHALEKIRKAAHSAVYRR
ncbi:MAG: hypothetical protein ACRD1B_00350 [Thermoanaerobaculia bacterium]